VCVCVCVCVCTSYKFKEQHINCFKYLFSICYDVDISLQGNKI